MTKEKFKRKIQVSDLDITLFSHHCVGVMVYNIYINIYLYLKKKKFIINAMFIIFLQ